MIKVLFICWGNICRSPLAQSVFTDMINKRGMADQFLLDSAAVSREEIGNTPHRGTVQKLLEVGIPLVPHRARQITWEDYKNFDYLIGMDDLNIRYLNRMLKNDPDRKIFKLLSFAGAGRDIADPWYTGNFDETYDDICEGLNGFLKYLKKSVFI